VVESREFGSGGVATSDSPASVRTKDSQTNSRPPHPSDAEHLLAASIVDRLIDAYFVFYNTSYPILHEHTFRERHKRGIQSNATSSYQLIFYMVLAIGHWVLGEVNGDSPYYAAARSRFSIQLLESGTLGGVQAFLLMVSLP
jgi:transcriptional regulatory protein GAL4